MKISKHIHSCLLIEEQGKMFLMDPGNYTFESNALDMNIIKQLDYLLITHEHMDHMYLPFIKQILAKFPHVQIFSNVSVKNILGKEKIPVLTEGNEFIHLAEVPHEKIFMGPSPKNLMITVFNKLSHPGDSLSFQTSSEIIALPIQAPWGSTTWAMEKAIELKPKIILPIHDWHWKEEVRKGMYDRLEQYLAQFNIIFKKLETGEVIEV